jgi:hypothetical protein
VLPGETSVPVGHPLNCYSCALLHICLESHGCEL